MAFATATLKNASTGETKYAPVGWSWTTLLFGPLPALFRGDFIGALCLILAWVVSWVGPVVLPTIIGVTAAAVYNRSYIARKTLRGFEIVGLDEAAIAFNGLTDPSLFRWHGREARSTIIALVITLGLSAIAFAVVAASGAAHGG